MATNRPTGQVDMAIVAIYDTVKHMYRHVLGVAHGMHQIPTLISIQQPYFKPLEPHEQFVYFPGSLATGMVTSIQHEIVPAEFIP